MKFILISLVKLYKLFLSPMLGPNKCRYQPTCSQYMIDAITEWGAIRGLLLGLKRLSRCHPYSKRHFLDPVPKKNK